MVGGNLGTTAPEQPESAAVARTESYTGSRWLGRTEQSKASDLLPSKSTQKARAAQTIDTSESLSSYQQWQDGYASRILPKDLSHWVF